MNDELSEIERRDRLGKYYDLMCDLVDEYDADDGKIQKGDDGLEIVLEFHND